MRRPTFLALGFLLVPWAAMGQTTSTDSQTLQALLAEVRQLRRDLQTVTLAAQRAQILIYRVQAQEGAVARAFQRLDEARSSLAKIRSEQKMLASGAKEYEAMLDRSPDPTQRKEIEEALVRIKARLEALMNDEQEMLAKEAEREDQLRTEQAALGRLQDELERLDKSLENSSRQPSGRQQ